jgi:hypothetical protein
MLSNTDLLIITRRQMHIDLHAAVRQQDLSHSAFDAGSLIVNINPDSNSGHWVALVIMRNKTAVFFDPFGAPPSKDIIRFMSANGVKQYIYNNNDIQSIEDDSCGYFCLGFLHFFQTNTRLKAETRMSRFTSLFENNVSKNRAILREYIADACKKLSKDTT